MSDSLFRQRFPTCFGVLEAAISEKKIPGLVAGMALGQETWICALGKRRIEPSEQPMLENTVFDLASLTKVLATAPLYARLCERGMLSYATPLAAILEEFRFPKITVGHLLSHTSGLPAWVGLYKAASTRSEMLKRVLEISPEAGPGERVVYSDLGFILLGFAVERVLQKRFRDAVRELVWNPLRVRLRFLEAPAHDETIAATERCPWRARVLQGEVHDENCFVMGGDAGHAGAFGAAVDVLRFSQVLMRGGLLAQPALASMWAAATSPANCLRTYGWDKPSPEGSSLGLAAQYFSKATVGHLGFTGTSLWIDPLRDFCVTLLTNRVHPSRSNESIKGIRQDFHSALAQDLRK